MRALTLGVVVLAGCSEPLAPAARLTKFNGSLTCDDPSCFQSDPALPVISVVPPGEPLDIGGKRYYLDGDRLLTADGKVYIFNLDSDVLALMHQMIDGAKYVEALSAEVSRNSLTLSYTRPDGTDESEASGGGGRGTPNDYCTQGFLNLYETTRMYRSVTSAFWLSYAGLIPSLNWAVSPLGDIAFSWGWPAPKTAVAITILGADANQLMWRLNWIAGELRVWGCLQ